MKREERETDGRFKLEEEERISFEAILPSDDGRTDSISISTDRLSERASEMPSSSSARRHARCRLQSADARRPWSLGRGGQTPSSVDQVHPPN